MTSEASTFRLLFVLFSIFALGYGGILWFLRELVSEDDTLFYWFFLKTPYIRTAKGRKEHAEFVSKTLMAIGLFFLFIGIFPSDQILKEWGVLGVGALIFGSLALRLIFVADANDRDKYSKWNEVEEEKIREAEEAGKLKD